MSFINSRLRRAESAARKGPSGRCPGCGLPPDGPGRIVYTGEGAPGEGFSGDPAERCTRCGRPLWCVIQVVYDSPSFAGDTEGGGGVRWP